MEKEVEKNSRTEEEAFDFTERGDSDSEN